ncbi:HET-domain-containing protein [Nemania diffusa]|nr:HET-domain-containing protein [Nemania diffusa]
MKDLVSEDLYEYSPLEDDTSVRLVTILPGDFDDPLRIVIEHKSLVPPEEVKSRRLSVKEIRRTLPQDWLAYETREGRILFANAKTRSTTWIHPGPDVDRALYDPIPDDKANLSVPVYEALSYAWGPPQKDEAVEVIASKTEVERTDFDNSCHQTRKLPVTRNLANALRHLRLHGQSRTMWIDAICINQNSRQEQGGQVQRMGQIYLLANRVVAWLGPSFPDSSLALKTLRTIGEQVEYPIDNHILPSPQCPHPDWYIPNTRLPFTMGEFAAVTYLCGAEYLRRLWVVQELHLANAKSIIMCGNEIIPWPCFRRAIICIESKKGIPQELNHAIKPALQLCRSARHSTLVTLIHRYHDRQCADARDKVYSLLNLVDQAASQYVIVDYSKPLLGVFKQVFLAFLEQEKRLGQLLYAKPAVSSTSVWPTWLPNWSQDVRITVEDFDGFQSSSISAARAKYLTPNRLAIIGLSFATVSTVGQVLRLRDGSLDLTEVLREIGLKNSQSSSYVNGESRLDAYAQTLATGQVKERINTQVLPTLCELRDEITRLAINPETISEQSPRATTLLGSLRWEDKPRVFALDNEYVGLFKGQLCPGDEVFIILGCTIPMVLRRTPTGEYEVVGNCYVHGIMDGEALLGVLPHPWKVEIYPNHNGHGTPRFRNTDTGITTEDDPRLANTPIPTEWEFIEFEWTPPDPINCRKFRNRDTGEIINSDPRLFPEALLERGIPLRTITLI